MNLIEETIKKIKKLDYSSFKRTQERLDNLTKPKGSLGRLEELAKQIVEITGNEYPKLENKVIFTAAADHGVVEEGVSAYPKEVTKQMVYNFLKGGAGINVLARHVKAKVIIIDMGVAEKIIIQNSNITNFKDKKINFGTKNFVKQPAMTKQEAISSIEAGIEVFEEEYNKNSIELVGIGDMGIGNTTSASAITSVITNTPPKYTTGRGTGIDDKTLTHKIEVIERAIQINKPNPKDAIDVLSKVGGFEIGGLVGIILKASSNRVPIVIDGFICAAAALIAVTLEPKVKDYMIASHCSVEIGHKVILDYMGLKPILNLDLRLGEGTGAALAISIIEASIKILTQMATFDEAKVSKNLINFS
jgi:nicotinate-nucleotide--dimethylbenzimidazole phosphoribosyltransferase